MVGATVVFKVSPSLGEWETYTVTITDDMIQSVYDILIASYSLEVDIYTGDMSPLEVSDGTYFKAQFFDDGEGSYYVSRLYKEN